MGDHTCEWLADRCQRPGVHDVAHPVHGVIKACQHHVDANGLTPIKPRPIDPESDH